MRLLDIFRRPWHKPGEICNRSGQWTNTHTRKQATCTKGEPMPPGPKGSRWILTDASRHASDD